MPPDSPWLSPTLGLLGELMVESFTKTGALSDLDQAVAVLRKALDVTATESPVNVQLLSNLARAVQARYETLGTVADQEQVLMLLQRLEDARRRSSS